MSAIMQKKEKPQSKNNKILFVNSERKWNLKTSDKIKAMLIKKARICVRNTFFIIDNFSSDQQNSIIILS